MRKAAKWTDDIIKKVIDLRNKGLPLNEILKILRKDNFFCSLNALQHKVKALRGEEKIIFHGATYLTQEKDEINTQENKVLDWLKKRPYSVGELSRKLDRSKETIIKIKDSLREKGYDVKLGEDTKQITLDKEPKKQIEPEKIPVYRREIKFGLISDTHLTSVYQQISLLKMAYKVGEEEKIDIMLHAGDFTDGWKHFKGAEFTTFAKGVDKIIDYTIEQYPKSEKFKTRLIGGRHDMTTKTAFGFNMLRKICEKRPDLLYSGDTMGDFEFRKARIRLHHPTGGLAYAKSYRAQKVVEALVGNIIQVIRQTMDITQLPLIVGFGHTHTAFFFPYMGSLVFSIPCFQAQTPYLEGRGLYPDIGMWIIRIRFDQHKNVIEVVPKLKIWNHLIKEKDY